MYLCGSLTILWHCLSFRLEWKLTFSSPMATAEFSKFTGNVECSMFTALSFRIWNSFSGIPSPPLALFIVMLPKVHSTSHSRMSGYIGEWSHHCDCLGHDDLFCTFLCIFATSFKYLLLVPYHFCPLFSHLCMKCSVGISEFLEEVSSLSHSVVFLYFLALITEEGFLISPCCSLELCIQVGIPFLFSFAFHFSSFHSYL